MPRKTKRRKPVGGPHETDLAATVEAVLRNNPEVVQHSRRIRRAQRRLMKLCAPDAWQAYLLLRSETNARADCIAEILLQRGFAVAKCHELRL